MKMKRIQMIDPISNTLNIMKEAEKRNNKTQEISNISQVNIIPNNSKIHIKLGNLEIDIHQRK